MSEKDHKPIVEEDQRAVDQGRRELLKGAAVAAGTAAALAGGVASLSGGARADTVKSPVERYVPPGQYWYHLDVAWYELPSDDPAKLEVWGYADKWSYLPGEEVALHVNTGAPTFDIKIYRDGATLEEVHTAEKVPGKRSPTPDDCFSIGCGWPALYKWTLPADLKSGFYLVVFSIENEDGERVEQEAGFTVRAASPKSPIVFMLATMTWIAYNDWGGGNYYSKPGVTVGIPTEGAVPEIGFVPRLHLHRPWARGFMRIPEGAPRANDASNRTRSIGGYLGYPNFDWAMANGYSKWCGVAGWAQMDRLMAVWAEKNGFEIDYITQHDLEANPDILNGYKCLLTAGHDEYYTWGMRDAMDAFMEAGGGFARFGGNINWQVRVEDGGLVTVAYKDFPNDDPVRGDAERGSLLTQMWEHPEVGRPAATTFAASSAFGHLGGFGGAAPRSPGYVVYQPEHWMLDGTDLYFGDAFGTLTVGYEGDGVPLTMRDMRLYPADEFGTPQNIEIVAMAPITNGEEIHDPKSRVFAGGGYLNSVPITLYNLDPTATPSDEQLRKHRNGNTIVAYMPKGQGGVATAATVDWCYGLGRDPFVDRITQNVLKRFTS
jgi:hypothetical protein